MIEPVPDGAMEIEPPLPVLMVAVEPVLVSTFITRLALPVAAELIEIAVACELASSMVPLLSVMLGAVSDRAAELNEWLPDKLILEPLKDNELAEAIVPLPEMLMAPVLVALRLEPVVVNDPLLLVRVSDELPLNETLPPAFMTPLLLLMVRAPGVDAVSAPLVVMVPLLLRLNDPALVVREIAPPLVMVPLLVMVNAPAAVTVNGPLLLMVPGLETVSVPVLLTATKLLAPFALTVPLLVNELLLTLNVIARSDVTVRPEATEVDALDVVAVMLPPLKFNVPPPPKVSPNPDVGAIWKLPPAVDIVAVELLGAVIVSPVLPRPESIVMFDGP